MVVFECHPRIHDPLGEMVQFVEFGEHVILDGLGQRHVVRRENQFHICTYHAAGWAQKPVKVFARMFSLSAFEPQMDADERR
jgi:hypothetical protein